MAITIETYKDDILVVSQDGKVKTYLKPRDSDIGVKINQIRIQCNDDNVLSLQGFAYCEIKSFKKSDKDTLGEYHSLKSKYITVTIYANESSQKDIADTNYKIGITSVTKSSWDTSANLSIDINQDSFNTLFELVKLRQLTSLYLEFRSTDNKNKLYQEVEVRKISETEVTVPTPIRIYALEDMVYSQGEVQSLTFATEPLDLPQDNFGYYGVYSEHFDSYESYLREKRKPVGEWESLDFFKKAILVLLALTLLALTFS